MVYATVEVKGKLRSKDIRPTLESIGGVRRLAHQCWYEYPRNDNIPGRWKLDRDEKPRKRPGRAFVFAFDTSYKSSQALKKALERELSKGYGAHIHGIVVLSRGWFAFQRPYTGKRAKVEMFESNGLLRFVNSMLKSLKGVVVREAEMSRYLKIQTAEEE
jgi:hypothetical protein